MFSGEHNAILVETWQVNLYSIDFKKKYSMIYDHLTNDFIVFTDKHNIHTYKRSIFLQSEYVAT